MKLRSRRKISKLLRKLKMEYRELEKAYNLTPNYTDREMACEAEMELKLETIKALLWVIRSKKVFKPNQISIQDAVFPPVGDHENPQNPS